jgi:response regulator RpfG family c-di-GMP phosphodiesterase
MTYTLLCIDDEREVLEAVRRDLRVFEPAFRVEACESADEARSVVHDIERDGGRIALVLADHVMPGTSGVDFLVELHRRPQTAATRKVLLTAQAGHHDTIHAVNNADLDHYIAKPWTPADLHGVVRRQLTDFLLAEADDLLPYVAVLQSPRLMEALRHRPHRPD